MLTRADPADPVLAHGWRPRAGDDHARAAALGRRLRADWLAAGASLPLLVIESHCSLLRGAHAPACWGAALRELCADHQGPWAVLADHGDLIGLPQAIAQWGSQRVAVGVRLPLPGADGCEQPLLALARDRAGYAALCRLCSWRHEQPAQWRGMRYGGWERLPWRGLDLLLRDEVWAGRLHACATRVHWWSGRRPARVPDALAARGVRPVAAPVLTWLEERDRAAEPVLAAIRGGTTVERALAPRPDPLRCRLDELPTLHRAYAGFEDQWRAGGALLAPGAVFAGHDPEAPRWLLPAKPPLLDAGAGDADAILRRLAADGIPRRYGPGRSPVPLVQVRARLEHELDVIRQTGFAGYILTVWDLARDRRTCGRGSAASSLVCYLLGLTNVDPVHYRLLFERFLMPERRDPPDIDIDFPWDERDHVIRTALQRYGRDRAAMVATHQRMDRWGALREAARAHGLDDRAISAMRRRLDQGERFAAPLSLPPPWPAVLAAAAALIGRPHHLGLHCGGVVITAGPIRDLVPVHPAAKTIAGEHLAAVAWEKDGVEQMGLVKSDLLGNRSLAVIRDAVADLAEDGITIPAETWQHPDTDPVTAELVAAGDTMGCFYVESPATRQLQQKAGSGEFDRLVIHSSIIRPAGSGWIDRYLERLHDFRQHGIHREEWYPHPVLRRLLSESYGVLSYQEDVMLVCREVAGFSHREADQMRKALGQWGGGDGERQRRMRERFHRGCAEREVAPAVTAAVWAMIESFTGYSFCKAHSASYAMVSFQCAYLKAHHPAHFLARVVANGGGFYAAAAYLEEARRRGIALLPPCVQRADHLTRRAGPRAIGLGFHLVHGLGAEAGTRIAAARRARPFRSLGDLRARAGLGESELRALLDAGGLDGLLPAATPAQRAWLVARAGAGAAPRGGGADQQAFDLGGGDEDPSPPALPAVSRAALDQRQFAALGVLVARHPLMGMRLPRDRVRGADLHPGMAGRRLRVVGRPITSKQVDARYRHDEDGAPLPSGQQRRAAMSFVTLEDESALIETVWFPEVYRRHGRLLDQGGPLVVDGRLDAPFGCVNLQVDHVAAL